MCNVVLRGNKVGMKSMDVVTYREIKEMHPLVRHDVEIEENVLGYLSYSSFQPYFVPIILDGCFLVREE